MKPRQQLIWVKNNLILGMNDYHFKHEPCFYGWKDGAAHYFVNDRTQTTVIEEAKPQASKLHPTMKPIKLLARHIRNSSKKSEKVIDLFGGSGSTLMACEELGRKCYMMEYDPQYVDVIIKRWEDFTGRKAEKIK
jgi:site-specific DNA-methyltransferase (adenine-specific)